MTNSNIYVNCQYTFIRMHVCMYVSVLVVSSFVLYGRLRCLCWWIIACVCWRRILKDVFAVELAENPIDRVYRRKARAEWCDSVQSRRLITLLQTWPANWPLELVSYLSTLFSFHLNHTTHIHIQYIHFIINAFNKRSFVLLFAKRLFATDL